MKMKDGTGCHDISLSNFFFCALETRDSGGSMNRSLRAPEGQKMQKKDKYRN